jgi:hypothetical protein
MSVVTEFVIYIERQQQAAGNTQGQPNDIDEGIYLGANKVAKGDLEIILKHGCISLKSKAPKLMPPETSIKSPFQHRTRLH